MKAKPLNKILVVLETSVMAPINGDVNSNTRFEMVRPHPKYAVLTSASNPDAQKSLKNIGKKAAITVVAKAEFPPSYKIQAFASGDNLGLFIPTNSINYIFFSEISFNQAI